VTPSRSLVIVNFRGAALPSILVALDVTSASP
jgi:hypothetical protein